MLLNITEPTEEEIRATSSTLWGSDTLTPEEVAEAKATLKQVPIAKMDRLLDLAMQWSAWSEPPASVDKVMMYLGHMLKDQV